MGKNPVDAVAAPNTELLTQDSDKKFYRDNKFGMPHTTCFSEWSM